MVCLDIADGQEEKLGTSFIDLVNVWYMVELVSHLVTTAPLRSLSDVTRTHLQIRNLRSGQGLRHHRLRSAEATAATTLRRHSDPRYPGRPCGRNCPLSSAPE